MRNAVSVFIFRRDLRVADNLALLTLHQRHKPALPILPVFFFNPVQIEKERNAYYGERCVRFMMESLHDLNERQLDGRLLLMYGRDSECLDRLCSVFDVAALAFNRDYTPFAVQRDEALMQWCRTDGRQIAVYTSDRDYTLLPPDRVVDRRNVSQPAKPHTVYTQFYKGCLQCIDEIPLPVTEPNTVATLTRSVYCATEPERRALYCAEVDHLVRKWIPPTTITPITSIAPRRPHQPARKGWHLQGDTAPTPPTTVASAPAASTWATKCGGTPSQVRVAPTEPDTEQPTVLDDDGIPELRGGREAGLQRLHTVVPQLKRYKDMRDYLSPQTTSFLSPYMKFGCISTREVFDVARKAHGLDCHFVKELFWREFFAMILYRNPNVCHGQLDREGRVRNEPFVTAFRDFEWKWDDAHWEAFRQGRTGVPLVDASVRCLNETGWAHNRSRMVMGNYAVMALHVDWRVCERWYATKAIDYDVASNSGGWQWLSGQGTDAAPYLRVFNPFLQSKKFDSECRFIRRWVPELREVDVSIIHDWNRKGTATLSRAVRYPLPLVDFKSSSDALGAAMEPFTRGAF